MNSRATSPASRAFGLFIELIEHYVEGLVHVSTMADDYYRFVESGTLLRGENTEKVYRLGDKVAVQVVRVNMDVRQIDLGLVEILERVREGERGPRRSKAPPKHEGAAKKAAAGTAGAREAEATKLARQLLWSASRPYAFLEVLDRAADALAELRQPVCAEDHDDDYQDDDQFRQSDAAHVDTPSVSNVQKCTRS